MQVVKRTIFEIVILVVVAIAIGLTINGVRASGSLKLTKNYFDKGTPRMSTAPVASADHDPAPDSATGSEAHRSTVRPSDGMTDHPAGEDTSTPAGAEPATTRSEPPPSSSPIHRSGTAFAASPSADMIQEDAHGDEDHEDHPEHPYQEVSFRDVRAIFEHPSTAAGANIFIDARNDAAYTDGHIPGALQVDHYQVELYIDQVMPWIEAAEKVVVYCNGGDCEDSIFVCGDLMELGVPYEKVYLYPGGWKQWKAKGMPTSSGPTP